MDIKMYTVVLLFNRDGSKILLQKKDRTAFAGKLNGIGGKVGSNETPREGACRKICEEASLWQENIDKLIWIGNLTTPEQCDSRYPNMVPELWFYAGIVKDESLVRKPETETGEITWYMLSDCNRPFTDLGLAGNGSLEYFIKTARRLLFGKDAASYE